MCMNNLVKLSVSLNTKKEEHNYMDLYYAEKK